MTTIPVCVITPTLYGREEQYAAFLDRLDSQTVSAEAHYSIIEEPTWTDNVNHVKALVTVRNRLLNDARGMGYEWVVTGDDDDEWEPDHLETLWRAHELHRSAQIVYALAPPPRNLEIKEGTNPYSCMVNEALLHLPSILGVGGYTYRLGWNEDVLADQFWVVECGLERVFTDHPTWHWRRGTWEHAVDRYGRDHAEEYQAMKVRS